MGFDVDKPKSGKKVRFPGREKTNRTVRRRNR